MASDRDSVAHTNALKELTRAIKEFSRTLQHTNAIAIELGKITVAANDKRLESDEEHNNGGA